MSLQIWLPLDGDAENKGLANAGIKSSNITFQDGKIGKAAYFSNSYIGIDGTPITGSIENFSICFWAKLDNTDNTMAFYNGRVAIGGAFGIFLIGSHFRFDDGAMHDFSFKPASDTWYHICFTRNKSTISMYVNGALEEEQVSVACSTPSTKATIGQSSTNNNVGNGINKLCGCINDFRIYNHCLSPKEVREISKGLCLHYRLSGHGGENLLKNAPPNFESIFSNFNGNINKCVDIGQLHIEDVEANEPITLKAVYKYKDIIPSTGNTAKFWIQGRGNINSWTGGIGFFPSETISGTGIKAVIRTANLNESQSKNDYFWMNTRYDYVKSGSIQLVSIKAEKGKNATPWTPAKGDALYTTLGYDSTIEPDCSGFGHDGVKSGEIVLNSDTPRYSTSYGFKDGITISAKEKMNPAPTDAITISVWIHIPDYQRTCAVSCYESGGVGIHLGQNSVYFQLFGNGAYHSVGANISKGSWAHVVGTFDGEHLKIYVNGQLKGAVSYSGKISYNGSVPWMVAGNPEANGNASENFTGRLSDLRIYATALSAEDILDLYQTGASIDNAGNAYAYELMENKGASIEKTGIVNTGEVVESDVNSASIGVNSISATEFIEI